MICQLALSKEKEVITNLKCQMFLMLLMAPGAGREEMEVPPPVCACPVPSPSGCTAKAHEHHIWGYFSDFPPSCRKQGFSKAHPISPQKPQASMITHLLRGDSEAPLVPVMDLSWQVKSPEGSQWISNSAEDRNREQKPSPAAAQFSNSRAEDVKKLVLLYQGSEDEKEGQKLFEYFEFVSLCHLVLGCGFVFPYICML